MADLNLSLVAEFDTSDVTSGANAVEQSIDKVSKAEKSANETTKESKRVTDSAAKAEADRAKALDAVRSAIDPQYAAQAKLNSLLGEAQRLYKAEALSLAELNKVQRLHAAGVETSTQNVALASQAYRNIGFQIQDVTQGLALGISPFTILAQQGGQLAAAFEDLFGASKQVTPAVAGATTSVTALNSATSAAKTSTIQLGAADLAAIPATNALSAAATVETGALGGVTVAAGTATAATTALTGATAAATVAQRAAAFAAGPYGAAIIAVVAVLGSFILNSRKAKEETEDLTGALDFQKLSHDELAKAINAQIKEAEKAITSADQQARAARDVTKANLEEALSIREKNKAALEANSISLLGGMGGTGVDVVGAQATGLRADDANTKAIAKLEELLRLQEIPLERKAAEEATDKAATATRNYTNAEELLTIQRRAGFISGAQYQAGLEAISAARKKDLAAIRETEREQKKLNKENEKSASYASFGSPIAGATLTSGLSGARRNPVTGRVQPHNGLDLAAPAGTRVSAPQVGVVKSVGFSPTLGKYVVLDHGGGTTSRYGHLSDNSFVREGESVAKGDRIGSVGSTGRSTGNHLHYEVRVNGKPVDPSKGRFPIDDVKVAESAEKAQDALKEFGDKAGESIRRVSERFDEQPRLIDQAAQATRDLDKAIAELSERQPIGWEEMVKQAQAAKVEIADALLRPFEDLEEASERRMTIETLIAANREDEAEALQIIYGLEEKLGPLTDARKRDIVDMVARERELSEVLEGRREITEAYLDASRSARQEVEAILSGQGKLSNFKDIFKNLSGRVLTEKLFGDVFRDFDKFVKEETAISSSVDLMTGETERAGNAAGDFADTVGDATQMIKDLVAGRSSNLSTIAGLPGSSQSNSIKAGFAGLTGRFPSSTKSDGDIVVNAMKGSVNGLTPERYFGELTKRLVRPLLEGFDKTLGTNFFAGLEGVISGALTGYVTGGETGGLLGGLKGIKGLGDKIDGLTGVTDTLGKGLAGAQTGTMVSGIGNMLGIKNSKTGAQIGGAVGSFLPIPGGDIIGAIAGGLIGGLFKKTSRTSANLSSVDGAASFSGSSKYQGVAGDAAGAVQSALKGIIESLGGSAGNFAVSIGQSGDSFHVDTTGQGRLRKSQGGKDFGDDQAAAVAYAIADAIADGAVKGISPAVAKALRSDPDIDKAVAEALKVKDLEKAIAQLDNPLAGLFDEFLNTAKDRVALAKKYGIDLAKVEALNAKERAALVDEAIERQVGSLKQLLTDLDYGSLFEGSPAERRQKILAEIGDAKTDVGNGVDGATNRLADLERQLVETSRTAFGTAGPEYAADLAEARSTAERIIKEEERRIREAAEATKQGLDLASETNDLIAGTNGRLDSLIGLMGSLGGGATGGAGYGGGAIFAGGNIRNPVVLV